MLKMIDILDSGLVKNFTHAFSNQLDNLDELIHQGMLNCSNTLLEQAIVHFMNQNDPADLAEALDINQQSLVDIQSGFALKKQNLAETAKIVALCLALETDALNQVNIAESLKDYPI